MKFFLSALSACAVFAIPEGARAQIARDKPIKTTLCEMLQRPAKFNSRMVELRAKFDTGMEFQGLLDDSCSQRIWLEWPHESAAAETPPTHERYAFIGSSADLKRQRVLHWRSYPPPVRLVRDRSYAEFEGYISRRYRPKEPNIICDCPLFVVTATFVGRFDFASMRAIKDGSGKIGVVPRMGFGHLNGWDGQLTLQSVSGVVAEPVKAWYTDRARPEPVVPHSPFPPLVLMPPSLPRPVDPIPH